MSTGNYRNKALMKSIITNGEEFDELIQILLHTGQDVIVEQLDQKWEDMCNLSNCDPKYGYKEFYSFGGDNDIARLLTTDNSLSNSVSDYPMIASPRGYCYLINNYFTIGTYKEMQKFRNIFYQLHFDVIMMKNVSVANILKEMEKVSKDPSLLAHNAFIFMIISRGNEKFEIFDDSNESIQIKTITEMFNDSNCPHMEKKPRLFFFNCCPNESNN